MKPRREWEQDLGIWGQYVKSRSKQVRETGYWLGQASHELVTHSKHKRPWLSTKTKATFSTLCCCYVSSFIEPPHLSQVKILTPQMCTAVPVYTMNRISERELAGDTSCKLAEPCRRHFFSSSSLSPTPRRPQISRPRKSLWLVRKISAKMSPNWFLRPRLVRRQYSGLSMILQMQFNNLKYRMSHVLLFC